MTRMSVAASIVALAAACAGAARADDPRAAVSAPAGTLVLRVHAVGAQIYECKPGPDGALAWQFREPIATLLAEGRTVGRHFAGPSWEMTDGSRIAGKVAAKAPGTTPGDIPWLRLDVSGHAGSGMLDPVTVVQRIGTSGGNKAGSCAAAGAMAAEPYAADYLFSKP